jgi:hypothetical protein
MPLTFATHDGTGRGKLWTPERPKDYGAACAMGREYGLELITHIQENRDPAILGGVIRAMIAAGTFDGVEAGFCSAIGVHLLSTGAPVAAPDTVTRPMPDACRDLVTGR